MTGEFAAAIAALSSAAKLAKGFVDLMRSAERQQILMEFNDQLLNAQNSLFKAQAKYEKLAKVKGDLERKLMEFENWEGEASRYELKELVPGILIYAMKAGMEKGEPAHYLCPHCFEKRQRSILSLPSPGWTKYVCHQCKFEAVFQGPTAVSIPRRPRWDGL